METPLQSQRDHPVVTVCAACCLSHVLQRLNWVLSFLKLQKLCFDQGECQIVWASECSQATLWYRLVLALLSGTCKFKVEDIRVTLCLSVLSALSLLRKCGLESCLIFS